VKGFTLIELLVVMAILGILSVIGFGSFQSARIKAQDAKTKSDLAQVAKSLEAYQNDHRTYPTTDLTWGAAFTDGTTTYFAKLPEAPTGDYYYVSNGTSYTLYGRLLNSEDPAAIEDLAVQCGSVECNYKITSSNLP